MRIALLAAALLTCGGHVEQRTDSVMGGWIIQVGERTGTMLLIRQGAGACGMFSLGGSSGWVYGLEAEAIDDGVRATFHLGGFEVHAHRVAATGQFDGLAWPSEYSPSPEDFTATRAGHGGSPGHPAPP